MSMEALRDANVAMLGINSKFLIICTEDVVEKIRDNEEFIELMKRMSELLASL